MECKHCDGSGVKEDIEMSDATAVFLFLYLSFIFVWACWMFYMGWIR